MQIFYFSALCKSVKWRLSARTLTLVPLKEKHFKAGFAKQENISLQQMMDNRFGQYYRYNFLDGFMNDPKQVATTRRNKTEYI
ncbi:hypothetical protein [Caedibacter taeniospiralis]|uniref:hypothetical protein n=1 Tax=Caedibacter taeniospiralis TaxID=28907 RepID=UPI0013029BC1|nr:hypothetical protein [Caedibacter taeniospiralis]